MIVGGGGTGGHLFPGLAVAWEISRRCARAQVLFVTGRRRMESEILQRAGFQQASIAVEGLKGRGWKKGAMVLVKLPYSLFQSLGIIRAFRPDLVLGVGGYSAGPLCLAARIKGLPTAIHEQNSFPGLTNRLLCRIAHRVFISFEESRKHFPGGSLILTGNPVRRELLEEAAQVKKNEEFTVLVTGGSQGARAVNQAFTAALGLLKKMGREPGVIHQTGANDYERVAEIYRREELKGQVSSFIEDMAEAYGRVDMVIGRAGATTVSELAALGKPAVLIPYPYAANNHQVTNAAMLVQAGGAEMLLEENLTGSALADLLLKYMDDRTALEEMGARSKAVGRPDAAGVIVNHLMEMVR